MSEDPTVMKAAVHRFYDDLWNRFDTSVTEEIIAPDVVFRGTLQDSSHDREGFKDYVREIEAAFPDFHQRIDRLWTDGDHCLALMFWSGTHRGTFRGTEATGRSFSYPGIGIFRFASGLITEVRAIGDTHGMWSAITPSPGVG